MLKQVGLVGMLLTATFTLPVAANPPSHVDIPGQCGNCNGNQGVGVGNIGVPGPIAGAGLPFLLIVGGYVLARRYRNRNRPD